MAGRTQSVRVHGPRVTTVQMRARCGSIKADLTTLGPEATPENASACRTDARTLSRQGVPGTPCLTAWANSGKSGRARREQGGERGQLACSPFLGPVIMGVTYSFIQ